MFHCSRRRVPFYLFLSCTRLFEGKRGDIDTVQQNIKLDLLEPDKPNIQPDILFIGQFAALKHVVRGGSD